LFQPQKFQPYQVFLAQLEKTLRSDLPMEYYESISSPYVKPKRPSPPGHQQRIRISPYRSFLSGRTRVSATGGGGTLHPSGSPQSLRPTATAPQRLRQPAACAAAALAAQG